MFWQIFILTRILALVNCSSLEKKDSVAPSLRHQEIVKVYEVTCFDEQSQKSIQYITEVTGDQSPLEKLPTVDGERQVFDDANWYFVDPRFKNKQPYSGRGDGYRVIRNVKDYGAVGDGIADDQPAIQRAIEEGGRCGKGCNSTSTLGAVIYFPPGTYKISRPIDQFYFTTFVGHPINRPTIVGSNDFRGLALIDTNPYLPGGNGWWLHTDNFHRAIRNFVLDLTQMPAGRGTSPKGIHWRVAQAATLQNIKFVMPKGEWTTHQGLMMEDGSGGFVSDLEFIGGKVGFLAGNQQYTARNLRFHDCDTAIEMPWDWGFTWKSILFDNVNYGIRATSTGRDGNTGRIGGTGTMALLDSRFRNVGTAIQIAKRQNFIQNVVLDNIILENVGVAVVNSAEEIMLPGIPGATKTITSWLTGRKYNTTGPNLNVKAWQDTGFEWSRIAEEQLTYGKNDLRFFEREKPQYFWMSPSEFLSVLDFEVMNDGRFAPQNAANINKALKIAAQQNKVLVFPAGVYVVDDTIFIPIGTRMVGILHPQIAAHGDKFAHESNPKVLVKVGNPGDKGAVEIQDFILTNKGPTAGTIYMQWNVHEATKGSAAIWDTIVRVGGAVGTEMDMSTCHQFGMRDMSKCQAGHMMLHVTRDASIYMENMWFWVADHDLDSKDSTRINVYNARGVLIESQGPSWVHSASSEHSTLYNWQLSGAKNIYLGHIQSETPYFQGGQTISTKPYAPRKDLFANDPSFSDCGQANGIDTCRESWGLRILDSSFVYLYGGAFYSFFQNYEDNCSKRGVCQDKLVETDFSNFIWLYNIWTVGASEMISPQGLNPVNRVENLSGFATALSAWLGLAWGNGQKGGTRKRL